MARLAAGSSNILPKKIKTTCGNEEFRDLLMDLIYTVWEECRGATSHQLLTPTPKDVNPQYSSSSANNVSPGSGGQATEPGANVLQREGSQSRSSVVQCSV